MKIAVIGAGQMGQYYSDILIKKIGLPAEGVILHDIVQEKSDALAKKYGAVSTALFPQSADAAIVAATTPAHAEVILHLMENGVKHILCEKPLTFTVQELEAIRSQIVDHRIYTALVINFSGVLGYLKQLMGSVLAPMELYGNWGKPRPLDKVARPSPGDVEDEAVHPIAFALALARGVRGLNVTARIGYLPFVDPAVQSHARSLDKSFPEIANHATAALMEFVLATGIAIPFDLRSSFLLARQVRQVGGVIGGKVVREPVYLFETEFDQKTGNTVADILTLTDIRTKTTRVEVFAADKLCELTKSFVFAVQSGDVDERLASFEAGSALVRVADAVLESSKQRGVQKTVAF